MLVYPPSVGTNTGISTAKDLDSCSYTTGNVSKYNISCVPISLESLYFILPLRQVNHCLRTYFVRGNILHVGLFTYKQFYRIVS